MTTARLSSDTREVDGIASNRPATRRDQYRIDLVHVVGTFRTYMRQHRQEASTWFGGAEGRLIRDQ